MYSFVHSVQSVSRCVELLSKIFGEEYGQFIKTATKIKQTKIIIKPMKTNTNYILLQFVSFIVCQMRLRKDKHSMNCSSLLLLLLKTQSSNADLIHVIKKERKICWIAFCYSIWLLNISKRTNSTFLSKHHTKSLDIFDLILMKLLNDEF